MLPCECYEAQAGQGMCSFLDGLQRVEGIVQDQSNRPIGLSNRRDHKSARGPVRPVRRMRPVRLMRVMPPNRGGRAPRWQHEWWHLSGRLRRGFRGSRGRGDQRATSQRLVLCFELPQPRACGIIRRTARVVQRTSLANRDNGREQRRHRGMHRERTPKGSALRRDLHESPSPTKLLPVL